MNSIKTLVLAVSMVLVNSGIAFAGNDLSDGYVHLNTNSTIVSECMISDHNFDDNGNPTWGCEPIMVDVSHTAEMATELVVTNLSIPSQPSTTLGQWDEDFEKGTITFVDSRDRTNKGLPLIEGKNRIELKLYYASNLVSREVVEIELVQEDRD